VNGINSINIGIKVNFIAINRKINNIQIKYIFKFYIFVKIKNNYFIQICDLFFFRLKHKIIPL